MPSIWHRTGGAAVADMFGGGHGALHATSHPVYIFGDTDFVYSITQDTLIVPRVIQYPDSVSLEIQHGHPG